MKVYFSGRISVVNVKTESKVASHESVENERMSQLLTTLNLPKVEIEKFEGDPLKYHSFMACFNENVDKVVTDDTVKLTRLLQYTAGDAKDAIRMCSIIGSSGYSKAKQILYERYGNEHLISQRLIQSLVKGKDVQSPQELTSLADSLRNTFEIMKSMN